MEPQIQPDAVALRTIERMVDEDGKQRVLVFERRVELVQLRTDGVPVLARLFALHQIFQRTDVFLGIVGNSDGVGVFL